MNKYFYCRLLLFKGFVFTIQILLSDNSGAQIPKVRHPADTAGFATFGWQMDSIMTRTCWEQGKLFQKTLSDADISDISAWETVICPHDDYTYVGFLYPAIIKNLKAKPLLLLPLWIGCRQGIGIYQRELKHIRRPAFF